LVKLLVDEPESGALRRRLRRWPDRVSATLLRTETVRALRRSGNDHLVANARRLFATIHLVRLDEPLLDQAADLRPAELRSLDAVHLAAALSIGPDLGVVVTYDNRMAHAAKALGLDVESPA
jgi:predicted nucleic acid-binding protein